MQRISPATTLFFFLLFLIIPAEADAASLAGQVVDSNSAIVSGARVLLRRQHVTFEMTSNTDQDGKFHFDNISEASYLLLVEGPGFSTYESNVALQGSEVKNVTITLQPAALAETVIITSSHLAVDSDSLK